jgi:hypothetical protein
VCVCFVVVADQADYLPRILFDSVFFIWVGLVLANIITGLMVDTFSAIREEEAERKEVGADLALVQALPLACARSHQPFSCSFATLQTFQRHPQLHYDADHVALCFSRYLKHSALCAASLAPPMTI